jgi:hypothetical protein
MTNRLSIDEQPNQTRRRFTAQLKALALGLCLQEILSCNAVSERLWLHSSRLARWVLQAHLGRG